MIGRADMHALVALHGQPGWVAALTPLSVDGMIVAASTTLLTDSRSGGRGGVLPWALLAVGSVASLAANIAVAEPTVTGRVIAAWPSFALIGSYELLMRQVRRTAAGDSGRIATSPAPPRRRESRADAPAVAPPSQAEQLAAPGPCSPSDRPAASSGAPPPPPRGRRRRCAATTERSRPRSRAAPRPAATLPTPGWWSTATPAGPDTDPATVPPPSAANRRRRVRHFRCAMPKRWVTAGSGT